MGQLLVITGQVAAGKSTVAAAVGARLPDAGLSGAVVDLDEMVATLHAPADLWRRSWDQARRAHAALIGGWLRGGVDVVLAHGPFHEPDDVATLVAEIPAGTIARWCWLDVTYDIALQRVSADPARVLSRDPGFLRRAHDRAVLHRAELPTPTWTFDTGTTPLDAIVAALADDLFVDFGPTRVTAG